MDTGVVTAEHSPSPSGSNEEGAHGLLQGAGEAEALGAVSGTVVTAGAGVTGDGRQNGSARLPEAARAPVLFQEAHTPLSAVNTVNVVASGEPPADDQGVLVAEDATVQAVAAASEAAPITAVEGGPLASAVQGTEARVRAANLDFLHRVNDAMSLPIKVLIEQRDAAFGESAAQEVRAREEQQRLVAEHEKFIGYLMEEQLANLRRLREQLGRAQEEVQRAKALAAKPVAALLTAEPSHDLVEASAQIEALKKELLAAYAEVDETRSEAALLQEEHDEAIRATDDVRVELQAAIDAARDETFEVQTKLDTALRQLDDAHDSARDEALALSEVVDDLRRQLDERNAEVLRLRERLGESAEDEVKHSRPPPPLVSSELEAARREVKWLRQQLIDAKRQLSRGAAAEAQRARNPRVLTSRGTDGAKDRSAEDGRTSVVDDAPGADGTKRGLKGPRVPNFD